MAPFDRSHTTFYWSAIVIIALYCRVFELLTLNNNVTLKSGLEVTHGHSNRYHLTALVRFPILLFHSNCGSVLHHLRDKARYW